MRKPRAVLLWLRRVPGVLGVAARAPTAYCSWIKTITAQVPPCNVATSQNVVTRIVLYYEIAYNCNSQQHVIKIRNILY